MKKSDNLFHDAIASCLLLRATQPIMKQQKKKISGNTELIIRSEDNISTPDFIKVEKNIASMGFFTPQKKESRRARTKTVRFVRNIDDTRVEVEIRISATEDLGLPTTADQDKYLAFIKLLIDQIHLTGVISNPFCFQSADILHELDLSDAGENYKELERWLDRMTTTTIISKGAVYLANKKRWVTDRFHVFSRAISTGRVLEDGTVADCNYVWLSEWQLENITNKYLVPIDFEAYKQLNNQIAKALVPLLQIWLYASQEDGFFEKRYDELCQILNLSQYKHVSKIKEKLGSALNELKEKQYISGWKVEQAASHDYFKVIFYHGDKFYRDRRLRLGLIDSAPDGKTAVQAPHALSVAEPSGTMKVETPLSPEQEKLINQLNQQFKVTRERAEQLVQEHQAVVTEQLNAWSFREISPSNLAGWIINAIKNNYELPQAYTDTKEKAENKSVAKLLQTAIAECSYCRNHSGMRFTVKGARPCTHDPAKEETDPEIMSR